MKIVVFDTVTLVQAYANSIGPAGECWSRVAQNQVTAVSSHQTRDELSDVLKRPKLLARTRLTEADAEDLKAEVRKLSILIDPVARHFSFERDPKDEPFLNLAIEVAATHIITRDRDMLDLRADTNRDHAVWTNLAPGVAIVTPEEFLNAFGKNS